MSIGLVGGMGSWVLELVVMKSWWGAGGLKHRLADGLGVG